MNKFYSFNKNTIIVQFIRGSMWPTFPSYFNFWNFLKNYDSTNPSLLIIMLPLATALSKLSWYKMKKKINFWIWMAGKDCKYPAWEVQLSTFPSSADHGSSALAGPPLAPWQEAPSVPLELSSRSDLLLSSSFSHSSFCFAKEYMFNKCVFMTVVMK